MRLSIVRELKPYSLASVFRLIISTFFLLRCLCIRERFFHLVRDVQKPLALIELVEVDRLGQLLLDGVFQDRQNLNSEVVIVERQAEPLAAAVVCVVLLSPSLVELDAVDSSISAPQFGQ